MGNEEGPQTYIDSTSCDVLLMTRFIVDKRSVDHTRDENALSVVNFTLETPGGRICTLTAVISALFHASHRACSGTILKQTKCRFSSAHDEVISFHQQHGT